MQSQNLSAAYKTVRTEDVSQQLEETIISAQNSPSSGYHDARKSKLEDSWVKDTHNKHNDSTESSVSPLSSPLAGIGPKKLSPHFRPLGPKQVSVNPMAGLGDEPGTKYSGKSVSQPERVIKQMQMNFLDACQDLPASPRKLDPTTPNFGFHKVLDYTFSQ